MNIQEIYNKAQGNNKTVMLYLRNQDNLNEFINDTNYLPDNITKSERYYCWLNNLKEIPKCPICGQNKRFEKVDKGYFATCGNKICKSAMIAKANAESYRDWNKIQKKMRSTYKAKTGYEHNMQNPEFKRQYFDKYKQTHDGVSCGVQSQKAIKNFRKYLNVRKQTNNNTLLEKLKSLNYTFIKFNDSNSSSLLLKCNKCKYEFSVTRYYLLHHLEQHISHFCPNCELIQNKSQFEQSVVSELKQLYAGNILFNNRDMFGIECDIVIPEYKLGIECNGIYWHSEKFRDKYYHINKKKQIENAGYDLIQIWD